MSRVKAEPLDVELLAQRRQFALEPRSFRVPRQTVRLPRRTPHFAAGAVGCDIAYGRSAGAGCHRTDDRQNDASSHSVMSRHPRCLHGWTFSAATTPSTLGPLRRRQGVLVGFVGLGCGKRRNLPCHQQPRDSATNASKNLKLGRRKFRASSTGRVKTHRPVPKECEQRTFANHFVFPRSFRVLAYRSLVLLRVPQHEAQMSAVHRGDGGTP